MHLEIMPELSPEYELGNNYLNVKNIGKGTAIKLRLQKTRQHYLDKKIILRYSLSPLSRRTIPPTETHKIYVVPDKKIDSRLTDRNDLGLDMFRFIEGIGKHRQLGLIYEDIFGGRMLLRVQFKEEIKGGFYIESYGIKRYGRFLEMFDWLDALRFRVLKWPRELNFKVRLTMPNQVTKG